MVALFQGQEKERERYPLFVHIEIFVVIYYHVDSIQNLKFRVPLWWVINASKCMGVVIIELP